MNSPCPHPGSELEPLARIIGTQSPSCLCKACGALLSDPSHQTWERELSLRIFYQSQN